MVALPRLTGSEFREIRLRLGLTQEQLATHFEMVRMTIIRWERRKRVPRIAELAITQTLAEQAPRRRGRRG